MTSSAKKQLSRMKPLMKNGLIIIITYVLLAFMMMVGISPEQHDIQIGAPAPMDILASKDIIDTVTTEEKRTAAAAAVEPSFKGIDLSVVGSVSQELESAFGALLALRGQDHPDQDTVTDEELALINAGLPVELNLETYAALITEEEDVLKALMDETIIDVRDVLNATLLEGQESAAVSRLSRQLTVAGYSPELISLATAVIRNCIRPNMLIDEETTEANRLKAREEVENVIRVKGEVIVRRGEIVTTAQYTMLSSLGLLKEDSLDWPLLAGLALILCLLFGVIGLYLYRYLRDRLSTRSLLLLGVISVLVTGICLGFSLLNDYIMPVSLGLMLIALLFDHRAALYLNIALGFIASLLTNAGTGLFSVTMFSVLLMSMVAGPIILAVFTRLTQRLTTLLAGALVGLSNFLCTMAVGLVNSTDISGVLTNALWALGGGIVSGILCIGLQPLLETVFNLATNSKLIELSNPNQPLLRRLMLEAPGTYHHSIVVANLAEAAAGAVGANPLLARVGAYYHDVGKLKRPSYFKENQMGDNPHDRTDPKVSAAILTAHPRDGAALAQKDRIPSPVLDIIRQHHGDGVVLYFYDKAVKQYGEENLDPNTFRYEGPRPRSKEAACVMLADTIEAAARSVPNPTPDKVGALIRKLVRNKLNDGQLDESELTFSDLEKICGAFSTVLTGIFHERIEYPDIAPPPRMEAVETDPAPSEPPAHSVDSADAPSQDATTTHREA